MRTSSVFSLLVGLVLGLALATSRAQEPSAACDAAAVHDAAKAAGLPVETVRNRDGRWEVVLAKEATPAQRVEAQAIEAAAARGDAQIVLAGGRTLAMRREPPLSLVDALAVLAVRPDDQGARRVVEERADRVLKERGR